VKKKGRLSLQKIHELINIGADKYVQESLAASMVNHNELPKWHVTSGNFSDKDIRDGLNKDWPGLGVTVEDLTRLFESDIIKNALARVSAWKQQFNAHQTLNVRSLHLEDLPDPTTPPESWTHLQVCH
jgi:hypothetical protein